MAELPILPLKTDALIADTTHMTAEEFGAYMRLLIAMWRHGGRLKDDDHELALIAGLTATRWKKAKERVLRPMTIAGGEISQKRLTGTWHDVQEVRSKRADAAAKRWKDKPRPRAMHMHEQSTMQNDAIQNQNQIYSTTSEQDAVRARAEKSLAERFEKLKAGNQESEERPVPQAQLAR